MAIQNDVVMILNLDGEKIGLTMQRKFMRGAVENLYVWVGVVVVENQALLMFSAKCSCYRWAKRESNRC